MAKPRKSKPRDKAEGFTADSRIAGEKPIPLSITPPKVDAGVPLKATAYIPLSEAPGVDPVDPVEVEAPEATPPMGGSPPGPPPPCSRGGYQRCDSMFWSPIKGGADAVISVLNRARTNNEANDHSNEGGPETVTDGNGNLKYNYLRRR